MYWVARATEIYFSQFEDGEVQRWRHWQIWCVMRAASWFVDGHLSELSCGRKPRVLWGNREFSGVSLMRTLIPFRGLHSQDLITSQTPHLLLHKFSSVPSLSCVWLFATPWTATCQASLSITNSHSLLKLMSIESVMPSNHLILYHPLLLLPSIFPSIRVFSNESVLHIR